MSRILIVEDDHDIATGLYLDLEEEGYRVEIVADGLDAARRARESNWDLILLDVMLPRKDGFEICRELRRSKIKTPVLMLTAKTQEAEKVLGLDLGADDYVTKPFSAHELRARIRALLRRATPRVEDSYSLNDCHIDFERAEIHRAGEAYDLTAIELKILRQLVRNPGRIVSREQIINEAWGRDVFVTDRVVDTHVMRLRRKIEPDPAHPRYILSARGLGYRFEP
jgi:DNA-binding response OmpR family regulator